jgi:hypothetical protein
MEKAKRRKTGPGLKFTKATRLERIAVVDRNHHLPPAGAPECDFCRDTGLLIFENRYQACRSALHSAESIAEKEKEAAEANESLDRLEKRVGSR